MNVLHIFHTMIQFMRSWSVFVCVVGMFLLVSPYVFGQRMRDLIDLSAIPEKPAKTTASPTEPAAPAVPSQYGLPRTTLNLVRPNNAATSTTNPQMTPWRSMPQPSNPPSINSDLGKYYKPSLPVTSSTQRSSAVEPPTKTIEQLVASAASIFEAETEDQQEESELQNLLRQAEQIADPDRRKETIQQLERSLEAFKSRLVRRQVDEEGADLFYVPRLKKQLLENGWCQLFDGRTQTGWNIQTEGPYAGGQFTFDQNDGISSDPYHPGLLYTTMPFGDVVLQFDFCAEKDSEVLLLLKTPPNPADLNKSCYTYVLNSTRSTRPRGILLGHHGLSFAELRTMREMQDVSSKDTDETWHTVRIHCEGSDCKFWIDNQSAMSYFIRYPLQSGHIAFLVAKGKARFKNIIWQPLPTVSIFDASNKAVLPWRASDETAFEGSHMTQFRLSAGSVESLDVFDNFILQMQYFQGAESGQSSLFVRSLPGQPKTGYEISLQNFPKRSDREAVVGVDAGSFRQIKDARYVRAQDQQWTYLTVAAVGRQLQTWVNGVPVCEIHDRRSVRANSPVGPFLQPGHLRWSVSPENILFEFRDLSLSPVVVP